MKIAILGSAFNPPTCGHASTIAQVLFRSDVDRVWLVPSYNHPFGKKMLGFDIRWELTQAFAEDLADKGLAVSASPLEKAMAISYGGRRAPVYTYDLLSLLSASQPQHQWSFIIGPDNAEPKTWARFYRAGEILKYWEVRVVEDLTGIRSTQVRNLLAAGSDEWETLVTSRVKNILKANPALYHPSALLSA